MDGLTCHRWPFFLFVEQHYFQSFLSIHLLDLTRKFPSLYVCCAVKILDLCAFLLKSWIVNARTILLPTIHD